MISAKLVSLRERLYQQGEYTPEMRDYVRRHRLDLPTIEAHAGLFAVVLAQLTGHNTGMPRWGFDPKGAPAAVIEVLAEDAMTVIDLVAWPLNSPERFATAVGEADMLGIPNMRNPSTYAGGRPLMVHRTPLAWLRAGCKGAVVLNARWGGYWLSRCPGPVQVEDIVHAQELAWMMGPKFDPARVSIHRAAA